MDSCLLVEFLQCNEPKHDHVIITSSFSMLVGGGANNYAMQQGVELCLADDMITGKRRFINTRYDHETA